MVEVITFVAYGLIIIIPALILGFGSMINSSRPAMVLAFINLISLLTYFNYNDIIPSWITVFILSVMSGLYVVMFRGLIGGTNG